MYTVLKIYTPEGKTFRDDYDTEAAARAYYDLCVTSSEPTWHMRLLLDDVLIEEADGQH